MLLPNAAIVGAVVVQFVKIRIRIMSLLIYRTIAPLRANIPAPCLCRCHSSPFFIRSLSSSLTRRAAGGPVKRTFGDKIPYDTVRLVNSETGKLEPPTSLTSVLASIDAKEWLVELVTEKPEPIVKVVNRKESFNKWKEIKRNYRLGQKASERKEIQMTWGVGPADLQHKIAKARSELERGYRVDVVIAPKKSQALPKPQEMQAFARDIAEGLSDVAKEWKQRDIQKTITVMSFQRLATSS